MHRRKFFNKDVVVLCLFLMMLGVAFSSVVIKCKDDDDCGTLGKCLENACICSEGWQGSNCQFCDGKISLENNTTTCQPCSDFTTGLNCERCISGFWGNPIKGEKCKPCECNNQARECDSDTGKCFCTLKGLIGDHCEKCDEANYYIGNPSQGPCFYALAIDYQFTFNLSKKEDQHYTQINFQNSPNKPNIDTKFIITCSETAKMNITVRTANSSEEKAIYTDQNCDLNHFKTKFSKSEYNFGEMNDDPLTTFYVYVYDFHTPLWIQVSFAQYLTLSMV